MTTTVRDSWEDARLVATQDVLDPDVAAVRRRIWIRRLAGIVLQLAVLIAALALVNRFLEPFADDDLWLGLGRGLGGGITLMVVGLVLLVVGGVRTIGASRPFVAPDALLSRADRAWLRKQVTLNLPVPDERRLVVADAAHRMVVEGRYVPTYVGWALVYVGAIVLLPTWTILIAFSVLTVVMVVRTVRGVVWSRRARRWLAQHA